MSLNKHGRESVELLKSDPVAALNAYNPPSEQWEMPLHNTVIERVQNKFSGPREAASDETFLKDIHTVLRSWYGNRYWLIADFDEEFKSGVKSAALLLDTIKQFRIENLQDDCNECYIRTLLEDPSLIKDPCVLPDRCCVNCMTEFLWAVIQCLNVTKAAAKIVSGTKTIHHLVPNLVPPMDNRYTGEFFLGYGIGEGGKSVFSKLYLGFVDLARCLTHNERFTSHVGQGFNTSLTKTLDNAIIAFVTREDMAMAHAIEEGMKTPAVSKRQLFDALLN